MLKRLDSPYGVGRRRGDWWKWKIDPFTVDAVLIYAQPGSGKRASLLTDYTFGVWDDGALVPFAKAYSGLSNEEIAELDGWIRRHTRERFGPVRHVEPVQVFELGFEAIARSSRHRSGIAVRFPRMLRWRRDKTGGRGRHARNGPKPAYVVATTAAPQRTEANEGGLVAPKLAQRAKAGRLTDSRQSVPVRPVLFSAEPRCHTRFIQGDAMSFDPAARVQDFLVFGEFGDVNPSITDSSTFTFLSPSTMEEVFEHEIEGCFLYSRHWNPVEQVPRRRAGAHGGRRVGAGHGLGHGRDQHDAARPVLGRRRDRGEPHDLRRHLRADEEPAAALRRSRRGSSTSATTAAVRAGDHPRTRVALRRVDQQPAARGDATCRRWPSVAHEHGVRAGGRQHLQPDDPFAPAPGRRRRRAQHDEVHQRHQRLRRRVRGLDRTSSSRSSTTSTPAPACCSGPCSTASARRAS